MKRKILVVVMTLLMVATMIPSMVFAASNVNGEITQGCMATVTDSRVRLSGELTVSNTGEELEIKLYSGDTHIATSTLVNPEYINKENQTLTWNFVISGEESSSWDTVWEGGMPRSDYEPTRVELYVDGIKVAENTVTMYKNNDEVSGEEYEWSELEGVTVIPKGTITQGCMATVTDSRVRLSGELTVSNTGEELEIKLYSGDTHIATSTLVNPEYINKENQTLTWNFVISGEESSSWKTVWEGGMPRSDYEPTRVELYVDGVKVAENTVTMYKSNDEVPGEEYEWSELEGVTVIPVGGEEKPDYVAPNTDDADTDATQDEATQTGDDFNMAIPFMLALMALAGMGAAVVARKRNIH